MTGSEWEGSGRSWRGGIALGAALVLALMLIALILRVSNAAHARDQAASAERHAYNVMLLVRGVGGSMARSEAALGRFILNGDPNVGTIYYDEWVDAGSQLDQLKALTHDDPDQAQLVAGLDLLYDQRGDELAQAAAQAAQRKGWQAVKLFSRAAESNTVPSITRSLVAIEQGQRQILATRAQQSQDLTSEANSFAYLLSLTGIALVLVAVGLGFATAYALAERRRSDALADEETGRAFSLESAVAERTRELSQTNRRLETEMAERAAAEAQLRQAQKMDAVGRLTGGIAHDFNNMLAVVVGGLELARRRLEKMGGGDEVTRQIDSAMEGAERAAALTRRLLGFARAEPLLPEGLDPAALIAGMLDMLDRTIGERVEIATEVAPDAWSVWVDKHQLENAILNLAVNARDAMAGHGRLLIALDNLALDDGEVGDAAAGDYVRIRVEDVGAGMSAAVLERVFEPFFTTKPAGQGTGLGLSQIFGFVRESQGEVAIRSTEGVGTAVSLYLPRYAGATASVDPIEPPLPANAPTGEPILLVEDDPRVLAATRGALEELGHRPVACESGTEALALLETRPDLRLIVTDVVMPGMTGPELIAAVRLQRPDIGALFVSGFVGEAGDATNLAGGELLRKPFTIAQLGRAVGDALAKLDAAAAPAPATARISAPRRARRAAAAG
ncbi:MAG: response regulator [Sphingomonadaceae bacterium]|nr:response regulator [Sphingomonadaceae bacterium]